VSVVNGTYIGLIDPIRPIQECHSAFFETIIAAVSDDSSDDLTVDNQFLHIAKDVAMAGPITNVLHQGILSAFAAAPDNEDSERRDKEIETIFREAAAVRLAVNDALRRHAERMSKDELIELHVVLGAKLDELLSAKIGRLVEQRSLAWVEQSERDPVTALPNRMAFNRRLRGEVERARRYRRELSIVLFDIDRFKSVNDRFGHPEGDRVLAEVASLLKSSLRQSDAVFRYGGDEFAALCPETSGDAMARALRRLEMNIPVETRLQWRLADRPGISWGAASFPADATEEDELIRIADDRLYACKRSHRRE
jgi:diguanylate cyclase (GGDEF)-like protein